MTKGVRNLKVVMVCIVSVSKAMFKTLYQNKQLIFILPFRLSASDQLGDFTLMVINQI